MSYLSSLSARSQQMSYEQFLVASIIYADIPHEKSLDLKRVVARSIRNKYTHPSRSWGKSVQEAAQISGITLQMVDSNDPVWQIDLQAANENISGPIRFNTPNSYTGGKTSLMAPTGEFDEIGEFEGLTFSRMKPLSGNYYEPSIESQMEKYTKSNYEDFVMASYLKETENGSSDQDKVGRMYVIKNAARQANKGVIDVIKMTHSELPMPYQLDQDWNNNNQLTNEIIGNYDIPELPDVNGIDGEIQLEGLVKKIIILTGLVLVVTEPNSSPAKIKLS